MLRTTFTRSPYARAILFAVAMGAAQQLYAQYGVSPSQNGMFFDDLRGRTSSRSELPQGESNTEGVYSYDDGTFMGFSDQGGELDEAVRDIGVPLSNAGYTIYSKRHQGDYTHFASPYPAAATFFAPTYTSDPFLGGKRNIKLGPANLGFGLSSVLEYNDNIARSSNEELSDVIAGAYLNISANWPVSKTSAISLSTALGFDHYFNHPEEHPYGGDFVLNVLPGSTLAFDGVIGPVYVVVYDRVSVRPASPNDFAINSNDIFGVFQNDLGVGLNWSLNSSMQLSFNYMHSTARVQNDELVNGNGFGYQGSYFDRDTDSIMTSLAWSPGGTWTAGLESNFTWVSYPENFNNNGRIMNAGAFLATPLGKSTTMRIAGGMQYMEFDEPPEFKRQKTLADVQKAYDELLAAQDAAAAALIAPEASPKAAASQIDNLNSQIGNLSIELEKARAAGNADAVAYLEGRIAALRIQANQLNSVVVDDSNQEVVDATQAYLATAQQQLLDNQAFAANNRDTSDLTDFYANFTISNRLNSRISHALTLGHESALNTTSNYITADFASYGVGIVAWGGSRLAISGYFEHSEESGGIEQYEIDKENIVQAISSREDLDQYGLDIYWTHQLTSRLRLGVGYHYGIVETNIADRGYIQQAFNLDLNYALSRKMTVGLGYRYFTTDADNGDYSFDQNRCILAFNYNF